MYKLLVYTPTVYIDRYGWSFQSYQLLSLVSQISPCPNPKESGWRFSDIERQSEGGRWHSVATAGQGGSPWREACSSWGERCEVLSKLSRETGHLLPLLHLQRAEVGVAFPGSLVLDPHLGMNNQQLHICFWILTSWSLRSLCLARSVRRSST